MTDVRETRTRNSYEFSHVCHGHKLQFYSANSRFFIVPTVIIMIGYRKIFRAVRRQVKSMPAVVQGPLGFQSIFGSSVRSAKNLFLMCIAYWSTFMPVNFSVVLRATGMTLPNWVQFATSSVYVSSSAINGILYISLHSYVTVRHELRHYLPRCRRATVTVAPTQLVGGFEGGQGSHGPPCKKSAPLWPPVILYSTTYNVGQRY